MAGIMAAKREVELIPLCDPLMLTKVAVGFFVMEEKSHDPLFLYGKISPGRTGVEIGALTRGECGIAYRVSDMFKAMGKGGMEMLLFLADPFAYIYALSTQVLNRLLLFYICRMSSVS